jgi:hypothetical protein
MFHKPSNYFCCLTLALATSTMGIASVAATPLKLEGTWSDGTQVISITEKDGFIDLLGKDDDSIYSCMGIVKNSNITCSGSGKNHSINKRFVYKGELKLVNNGKTIIEQWEVLFVGGERRTGTTSFKRQQPAAR